MGYHTNSRYVFADGKNYVYKYRHGQFLRLDIAKYKGDINQILQNSEFCKKVNNIPKGAFGIYTIENGVIRTYTRNYVKKVWDKSPAIYNLETGECIGFNYKDSKRIEEGEESD